MRETTFSAAAARCVINALAEAKRSSSYDERRFFLDQAAVYAHLAEEARRAGNKPRFVGQAEARPGTDQAAKIQLPMPQA